MPIIKLATANDDHSMVLLMPVFTLSNRASQRETDDWLITLISAALCEGSQVANYNRRPDGLRPVAG